MRALLTAALLCAALVGPTCAANFWERDIWREDSRPFLFYGEPEKEQPADGEPAALTEIPTLSELKAERERRLEIAIMEPTAKNMRAYLEANSFVLEKSATFAARWRDTIQEQPEFDWTALHPVVNSASTTLARERQEAIDTLLGNASQDWGLLFFADESRLTELMAPMVERFAARYRWELVTVDTSAEPAIAARTTSRGITQFPALVLLHREDSSLAGARLLATGVVDLTELSRRASRFVAPSINSTPNFSSLGGTP